MRGSHEGSYDYAHALRDGNFWKTASRPANTREVYDLVIAGCGISGLAAAYFYRKQNPQARILILDNHDDFGGHAKRNEFHIGRSTPITNGGTAGIESPFDYIVTNLETDSRAVVRFYNKRGTAEQWIKEGKQAVKMTRLSRHRFRSHEVRLWLSVMAYNLGNLWRRLVLPRRIDNWSLASL